MSRFDYLHGKYCKVLILTQKNLLFTWQNNNLKLKYGFINNICNDKHYILILYHSKRYNITNANWKSFILYTFATDEIMNKKI